MRYQMLFRMDANGVTPMPAPTNSATSYLNTSSDALPNGPSMKSRGRMRWILGSTLARAVDCVFMPSTAGGLSCTLSFLLVSKLQPRTFARDLVKCPTQRMWTEMKFSSGALVSVNGWYWKIEISGQQRKMY